MFLISDHWPYGSAVSSLARRFDVVMGEGLVEDAEHHDPERGASHLVFSEDNGLLRDHPIVRGRNPSEQVRNVLTFTGQSLQSSAADLGTHFGSQTWKTALQTFAPPLASGLQLPQSV